MSNSQDRQVSQPKQAPTREQRPVLTYGWGLGALGLSLLIVVLGSVAYGRLVHRIGRLERSKTLVVDLNTKEDRLQQRVVALEQVSQSVQKWRWFQIRQQVQWADWLLRYYHNETGALELLESARADVAHVVATSRSQSVLSALEHSIKQLKSRSAIDSEQVLLTLQSMAAQINTLPWGPQSKGVATAAEAHVKEKTGSLWQRFYQHSLKTLSQAVVIRHHQARIEPLIPPRQHAFLIEHIQLQLAKAQWSVLRQQPKVYQSSIRQVQTWIKKYFSVSAPSTQQILAELESLAQVNLSATQLDLKALMHSVDQIMSDSDIRASSVMQSHAFSTPLSKSQEAKT